MTILFLANLNSGYDEISEAVINIIGLDIFKNLLID